jgi:hypothetical protein
MSEAEFLEGQSALEQAATVERVPDPVVETIEMLVFAHRENSDGRSVLKPR